MINKIIEQALFEYMDNEGRQENRELLEAKKKIEEATKKINVDQKSINALDEAYTAEETVYQEMYFKEGFMTAIRLVNEISNIKSLGQEL